MAKSNWLKSAILAALAIGAAAANAVPLASASRPYVATCSGGDTTYGGLDSGPIHGHSQFTGCLIEGLTHGIRPAGNRVTTGSELGLYVQQRVKAYPSSRQTPDFGTFALHDRGEMAIPLLIEEPATQASPTVIELASIPAIGLVSDHKQGW